MEKAAAFDRPDEILTRKSQTTSEKNGKTKIETHGTAELDPLYSDPRKPEAKVFACKCGMHYFSSNALYLHIKTMKFGYVYTCKICLGGFRHFHTLKKHAKYVHEKKLEDFLCGFCHHEFNTHRSFTKHLTLTHNK